MRARKAITMTLSSEAIEALEDMAAAGGMVKSRLVEALILAAYEDLASSKPTDG